MSEIATGNREDALDIVQDAMLKLAEKYATKSSADWPPLFYRILQSRIRDWHRRDRVRRGFVRYFGNAKSEGAHDIDYENFAANSALEPDNEIQRARLIERLKPALQALPLRQQQVFLLRLLEGLDVRATATAMACSEGSVKTHYSRALATLREKLGDTNV